MLLVIDGFGVACEEQEEDCITIFGGWYDAAKGVVVTWSGGGEASGLEHWPCCEHVV